MTVVLSHKDWADVAGWLLLEPVDDAVNKILELIGRALKVDRAWVIRYNNEFTHFWNTHEWVRPGVPRFVKDLQGIPVGLAHWLHPTLQRGECFSISDLSAIPRSSNALKSEWERQGIKSLLAAPGIWQDKLVLQVGFDAVRNERIWSDMDVEVLEAITQLLTVALCVGDAAANAIFPPQVPVTPRAILRKPSTYEARDLKELVLIRAAGDYSQLYFQNGREALELRSLKYWQASLPPELFCRCHRSAVVNLRAIQHVSRTSGNWELLLSGIREPVPVGRRYRSVLRHHLGI